MSDKSLELLKLEEEHKEIAQWGKGDLSHMVEELGLKIENDEQRNILRSELDTNSGRPVTFYTKCQPFGSDGGGCKVYDTDDCPLCRAGIDLSGHTRCPFEKMLARNWFNEMCQSLDITPKDSADINTIKSYVMALLRIRRIDQILAEEENWMKQEITAVDPITGQVYTKDVMVPALSAVENLDKYIINLKKDLASNRKDRLEREQFEKTRDMKTAVDVLKATKDANIKGGAIGYIDNMIKNKKESQDGEK